MWKEAAMAYTNICLKDPEKTMKNLRLAIHWAQIPAHILWNMK